MPFDSRYFQKYQQLNWAERLFLRTCCYFPPRPRRIRKTTDIQPTDDFVGIYQRAFGEQLWRLTRDKIVLDLGCGQGGYVLALAEQGARLAVGVDIQGLMTFARQEADSRGNKNVAFVQGVTQSLNADSFDVVISHDSFEHFSQPAEVLAEMVRVTRPGGRILIKFGPPWMNPWGRHMSGTVRRDRPWVHLVVPERVVMRCHSVYHDEPILLERYADLPGGLNKMTAQRFRRILERQENLRIDEFTVQTLFIPKPFMKLPLINELFAGSVRAICTKET